MINKTKIAKFNFTIFTILLTSIMQAAQDNQEPKLISAVRRGDLEQVQKLANVNPNIKDNEGRTPLFVAVEEKDLTSAKLLLKSNQIDPVIPNNKGVTPLEQAINTKQLEMVKALTSSLNPDSINFFEEFVFQYQGLGPLIQAVKTNQPEMAKLLMDKMGIYAENMLQHTDKQGKTPMQYAAEGGNPTIIELFFRTPE